MIKKFIPILIVLSLFIISPLAVSAERLIANPTLITLDTAPHSAKKSTTKKSTTKRNLKLGSKGADVMTLQKFLIKKNSGPAAVALAKNKANGVFGQLTKDALLEFQKAKGLTSDGVAGNKIFAMYTKK